MSRRRRSSSKRSRNTTESTTDMIQSIRNEDRDIDSYRVVDLRSIAEELSIEIPPRTKKAEMVDLIRNNIFRQGTEVGDPEGDQEEDQGNALLQTAPHVDNGVGVGIPIGGALRAIPEQQDEVQDDQPNEPQPDNPQSNNTNSVTPTADGSGRHPDDVAFEQSGGMIVSRNLYERTIEVLREAQSNFGVPVTNLETNALRFLYERAKDRTGSYDNDSEEERAQNVVSRISSAAYGEPSPAEDAQYYNSPVDPSMCRLETIVETGIAGESNVRILKLRFPHTWSYYQYNLPPPWFCRTEKLEFDADSNKVVEEVRKSIVACLQQKQQIQTYKLRLDQISPFYIVNAVGDVILLNKEFLEACPRPGQEMLEAPTFFVCGLKQSKFNQHQNSEPLPHFVYYSKNPKLSYLIRIVVLIVLSCVMLDLPNWDYTLTFSPYLPVIPFNKTSSSKLNLLLLPLNMSYRVLSHTTNALFLPDVQYRACALQSTLNAFESGCMWLLGWFPFLPSLSFLSVSWWSTLVLMIVVESSLIWIRSRFCIVGLSWMLFRRYTFLLDPSTSKYGADPNPSRKDKNKHTASSTEATAASATSRGCCSTVASFVSTFVTTRKEEIAACNGYPLNVLFLWSRVLRTNAFNAWAFIQKDDWFGYRANAAKLLKEAADRNEGMCQIVYEDASTFRYFTYRWTPMEIKDSSDYKEWLKTLRSACGVPYDTSNDVSTSFSDLILSDDSKPGYNRVVSHAFLKNGKIAPMAQHPVYHVHPPGTRSSPASFRAHFMMVAPIVPMSCLFIWIYYELIEHTLSTHHYLNTTTPSNTIAQWECSNYLLQKHDAMRWMPHTWFRPFFNFLWMNTACGLVQLLQDDVRKKWRSWLPSNPTPWVRAYGLAPSALAGNELVLSELKRKTIRTVFVINVLFFAMSYGDFHFKMGALLIGCMSYLYYYKHTIVPLSKKYKHGATGAELTDDERLAMQRTWLLKYLKYCGAMPIMLMLHAAINYIGFLNVYHTGLTAVVGCTVRFVLICVERLIDGGNRRQSAWQIIHWMPPVVFLVFFWLFQPISLQEIIAGVLIFVVTHLCITPNLYLQVERLVRNQIDNQYTFIRDRFFLFLLPSLLVFILVLYLSTTFTSWLLGDTNGMSATLALLVVVWYCFYDVLSLLPW